MAIHQSAKKAGMACAALAVFGVAGWLWTNLGTESLPLLGYYVVLVINTFFSMRALDAITPPNTAQTIFDVTLLCVYAVLAFSFSSVLLFSAVSGSLFSLSIIKYMHLRRLTSHPNLLRRKITLNALGALLSGGALALALVGYPDAGAWTLLFLFAIPSIYLQTIPVYRLDR